MPSSRRMRSSESCDGGVRPRGIAKHQGPGDTGRGLNPLPRKGESPMSGALKVGDRVRVTAGNLVSGYQLGDKGTVLKSLENPASGDKCFYVVAMDKNHIVGGGMAF